jgi:DNA-binding NarL/FixJ family response regulator
MLASEPWVAEVVEAATAAEAVHEAVSRPVHVVAMDVALPDGDGVAATRQILSVRPDAVVLMLTMTDDEDVVSAAMRAGARGYLLKETDPDTVVDALRTVALGGLVLGPGTGRTVLTTMRTGAPEPPSPLDQLTPRELQILTELARGYSNIRIARHLSLSEKTVRNQLSSVFRKLGVADRVKAALVARDAGLGR